jgi:hypothetical protein
MKVIPSNSFGSVSANRAEFLGPFGTEIRPEELLPCSLFDLSSQQN